MQTKIDVIQGNTHLNDIQHNDTQHNDIQHSKENVTLCEITLSKKTELCYAERHLCWVSNILSVTHKPFMLNVIMVNAVMLSVIMLSVAAP